MVGTIARVPKPKMLKAGSMAKVRPTPMARRIRPVRKSCAPATIGKALTGDLSLLEREKCRGDREQQDVNTDVDQIRRLERMCHTGNYVAADDCFSALGRGSLMQGFGQPCQSSYTEHCAFEKQCRAHQQIR